MIRCLLTALAMLPLLGCEPTDKPDQPSTPAGKPAEKPKDAPKPVASKKKALNQAGTVSLETFEDGRRRVVRDLRTGARESHLDAVLREGRIDAFLLARLRQQRETSDLTNAPA